MDSDEASAHYSAFLLDRALETEGIQRALDGNERLEANLRSYLEESVRADVALDAKLSRLATAMHDVSRRESALRAQEPVELGFLGTGLALGAGVATMIPLVLFGASYTLSVAAAAAAALTTWFAFLARLPTRLDRVSVIQERLAEDISALGETINETVTQELRPIVRSRLNQLVDPPFGQPLTPADVDGLRSLFDARYDVSVAAAERLRQALEWLDAGSVGIAGPRGVGKTTLIRMACEGRLNLDTYRGRQDSGQLVGVVISTPVRYQAEDIVRLMFAELCLEVLSRPPAGVRSRGTGLRAHLSAAFRSVIRLKPSEKDPIRAMARENLNRLRYLETLSYKRSGELEVKLAKLGESRSRSRAEQAWTLPEVITEYRRFVGRLAEQYPVMIGIDELDKMADSEEARDFLNEMKSLFDQTGVFYLVSVSEDALSNFERRGRPIHDVFGSAFNDVLHIDYLRLDESVSMLDTRSIGITPPWSALFHCLAGGLPRETLRIARRAAQMAAAGTSELHAVMPRLIAERAHAHEHATAIVARERRGDGGADPVLTWLRELPPIVTDCSGEGTAPAEDGSEAAQAALRERLEEVEAVGGPENSSWLGCGLESLLMELAAGWHHALSCLEYFDGLTEEDFRRGCTKQGMDEAPIELLARGQQDLALSPIVSWRAVSRFREAVGLSLWRYPATESDTSKG